MVYKKTRITRKKYIPANIIKKRTQKYRKGGSPKKPQKKLSPLNLNLPPPVNSTNPNLPPRPPTPDRRPLSRSRSRF